MHNYKEWPGLFSLALNFHDTMRVGTAKAPSRLCWLAGHLCNRLIITVPSPELTQFFFLMVTPSRGQQIWINSILVHMT